VSLLTSPEILRKRPVFQAVASATVTRITTKLTRRCDDILASRPKCEHDHGLCKVLEALKPATDSRFVLHKIIAEDQGKRIFFGLDLINGHIHKKYKRHDDKRNQVGRIDAAGYQKQKKS